MGAQAKYRQVESYIVDKIRDGTLAVGDKIQTEEQLREIFPFSPMTINKALSNLSQEGYIERIPGKGSFVALPPQKNKAVLNPSSFADDMRSIGYEPGAELVSYDLARGSDCPEAAHALRLQNDDYLHHFIRLRTAGGHPIAVSESFISVQAVPALDISCLNSSLYDYLLTLGIHPQVKSQQFEAKLPSDREKSLLEADDIALLSITGIMSTGERESDELFEYTVTNYRGDAFSYLIEAGGRSGRKPKGPFA